MSLISLDGGRCIVVYKYENCEFFVAFL